MDFDINESLKQYLNDPKTIPAPEAQAEICDIDETEGIQQDVVLETLGSIAASIHETPDVLSRAEVFDTLQALLKLGTALPATCISKLISILASGLSNEADQVNQDVENEEQETLLQHKQVLERYAFLLQWCVSVTEMKVAEKSTAAPTKKGPKSKKSVPANTEWDSTGQIQTAMDVMCRVMKLKLNRIFSTSSDRDTFINMFTRPTYVIMESEVRMKVLQTKLFCFKVLCIAIKHHGHASAAQTSILQSLTYFEHLSEPMAELLKILAEQYDHIQLASEVLRELSTKEYAASDLKGPKAVSMFITKLSELQPHLVGKELGYLAKFLDSEAYTLRCAIIEICGNLLFDLSKIEERDEHQGAQIDAFFEVLEQRFLDTNPYCRCRAIQVWTKICMLDQKYPKRRQAITELAVQSLQDRSSNVRRNAVKLLGKLIATHPFSVLHGGELSLPDWQSRLSTIEDQINALKPPPNERALAQTADSEEAVDSGLLDEETRMDADPKEMTEGERAATVQQAESDAAKAEIIGKLKLTRKYYTEAIKFIEVVHEASQITVQLLSAKNKSEVIEAMDFFVILNAYKLETARTGIRKMLKLIWTKGNSDEGKGVQTHLIDCYKGLFFDAPGGFSANDTAIFIARNMISLTFGASPAELTSLEQLLATMIANGHVSQLVISKLWQVYSVGQNISQQQRRGAIIILGMIATADSSVVIKEMDTMMRVGLGSIGRKDLVLARWTCIALKRMVPSLKKAQTAKQQGLDRLPNDHTVLRMLASILLVSSMSQEWYGMAEQAISAIYVLSQHPDVLCSEVVRLKATRVFSHTQNKQSLSRSPSPEVQEQGDPDTMDIDQPQQIVNEAEHHTEPQVAETVEKKENSSLALSQLLFAVGHIAIKQIVHLELCELDFKRRKQAQEKDQAPSEPITSTPAPSRRRSRQRLLVLCMTEYSCGFEPYHLRA